LQTRPRVVRQQRSVDDVTTGTLHELSGHNAIESGTIYKLTNWTIPGGPQAYAVVG